MKVWNEPIGADADGLRGMNFEMYQLEAGDEEWLLPLLYNELLGWELKDLPKEVTLTIENPITGYDMDIEVKVGDWLNRLLKLYPRMFEDEY